MTDLPDILARATNGPWTGERDLPWRRMPRVHGADQSLVCECGNVGTTQDQWEANAALIALAPQLAEYLLASEHDRIVAEKDDAIEALQARAEAAEARVRELENVNALLRAERG